MATYVSTNEIVPVMYDPPGGDAEGDNVVTRLDQRVS